MLQVTTSFINYGQDSVAHINATGHSDALHYLVTTIGKFHNNSNRDREVKAPDKRGIEDK